MSLMTTTSHAATSVPLDSSTITGWVDGYLRAWTSNSRADIAALFTEDAEYSETPFETNWIGREAIIDGWRDRWDWQQGGWTFDWSVSSISGRTAVLAGVGHYAELGEFDNVWTVTFDESGRCSRFEMVNTERG
jgi:SnoaL-like domain